MILDITIKSGCDKGWILAPTWEMVNTFKSGLMSEETFTNMYFSIVNYRWDRIIPSTIEWMKDKNLILVCYCPQGQFCHRYLAAEFLVKKMGATYFGEHQTS